jgi:hypothetical protein
MMQKNACLFFRSATSCHLDQVATMSDLDKQSREFAASIFAGIIEPIIYRLDPTENAEMANDPNFDEDKHFELRVNSFLDSIKKRGEDVTDSGIPEPDIAEIKKILMAKREKRKAEKTAATETPSDKKAAADKKGVPSPMKSFSVFCDGVSGPAPRSDTQSNEASAKSFDEFVTIDKGSVNINTNAIIGKMFSNMFDEQPMRPAPSTKTPSASNEAKAKSPRSSGRARKGDGAESGKIAKAAILYRKLRENYLEGSKEEVIESKKYNFVLSCFPNAYKFIPKHAIEIENLVTALNAAGDECHALRFRIFKYATKIFPDDSPEFEAMAIALGPEYYSRIHPVYRTPKVTLAFIQNGDFHSRECLGYDPTRENDWKLIPKKSLTSEVVLAYMNATRTFPFELKYFGEDEIVLAFKLAIRRVLSLPHWKFTKNVLMRIAKETGRFAIYRVPHHILEDEAFIDELFQASILNRYWSITEFVFDSADSRGRVFNANMPKYHELWMKTYKVSPRMFEFFVSQLVLSIPPEFRSADSQIKYWDAYMDEIVPEAADIMSQIEYIVSCKEAYENLEKNLLEAERRLNKGPSSSTVREEKVVTPDTESASSSASVSKAVETSDSAVQTIDPRIEIEYTDSVEF